MPAPAMPLRERKAQQVRAAVLEAVVGELETRAVEELSMAEIAAAAGVSLRTLYRYFPDRASLLDAAAKHLVQSLGVPVEISGPESITASFLDAARRFATRPDLARALVQTAAGRAARSSVRPGRAEAIAGALAPLTEGATPEVARRAGAVITHLCSLASWVAIAEESGLDDAEAQLAVAWAIDALVAALAADGRRPRPRPHPQRSNASQRKGEKS